MGVQVLIVDDSAIVRKVLLKALKLSAAEIEQIFEAENGLKALEVLDTEKIDLIFLDINMPVMNGVEFIQKMRADEKFTDIPVIVVSTEGGDVRRNELEKHGVAAYLRKPVTPETINSTFESVINKEDR